MSNLKTSSFLLFLLSFAWFVRAQGTTANHKAEVMVVGAYHFVSKANVHNSDVDDPTTPKRQAEINDLVEHLKRFQPTKVILEQTSGTSDVERNYQQFLAGKFSLPPSENYQIGFRLAKSLGLTRIYLTDAQAPFDYEATLASAKAHHQEGMIHQADVLSDDLNREVVGLQAHGTILDMYRFYNTQETIARLNAPYMFLARIGANDDFAGAKMVASWHLRNMEMFAQLTQIISSPNDRTLILYGAGHAYLLRDYIRQSPDLTLVDPATYLR